MIRQSFRAVGRLAADVELRYTPSGQQVANARVAVNDGYYGKDSKEWVDRTLWATLVFWGNAAESMATKAHKGDVIDFTGTLVYDENGAPHTFQRKDGTTGAKFEIRVDEYQVFPKNSKPSDAAPAEPEGDASANEVIEEIPF